MKNLILTFFCSFLLMLSLRAQSTIPKEYRGTENAIARGVLDGNNIETNFRNHGEMARWNDTPWGDWPKGSGAKHIDGMGFIVAGRVVAEKAQWLGYGSPDTLINPVIINYQRAGRRESPYSGSVWGWLPLPGFNNPYRNDSGSLGDTVLAIPATSVDETSWPEFWPDKLGESTDAGWGGSWNGFRGKGLVTGDQETFYVMDDFSDYEYGANIDTEGPHSSFGVYFPSPSDSSIGGLGLQTEVRTFQFDDYFADDMLFTQYRTTNVSEKDIPETWTTIYMDVGLGAEEWDDNAKLIQEENLVIFWDSDGLGDSIFQGEESYELGYVGLLLLEHSMVEDNGIDEDQDGMIDESKFNGPGELIEGKAAIDAYLQEHYNMELFEQNFQELSLFPAYANERWWTGDEDLDWVSHEDFNLNGIQDDGEELIDDLGRDGLGPNHENYPGPDEGEGDGIPTQGEPNFGEQDMMEAEERDIGAFEILTNYYGEYSYRDDTWMYSKIEESLFSNPDYVKPTNTFNDEQKILFGSGSFTLKKNESTYFTTVLIFGEDETDIMNKARWAKLIYESDFGQSPLVTSAEEEKAEVPEEFSLSQNYPNPFNPTTNIEFSLSKSAPVNLTVFDITGRQVRSLVSNKNYTSGKHSVQFDASNLSSGIYIYRLQVNGEVFMKKLTLIK